MARRQTDVFGFDELKEAFAKMEKKYPVQSDAMLAAEALQVKKRVKQKTPRVTGTLRKGWRDLRPKAYRGGSVKVARVQNAAPHAHLYEYPHKVYTTRGNRRTGKVGRYNAVGRRVQGIKSHGSTEGHYVLHDTMREMETRFHKSADEMLDKITKEAEI